MKKMTKSRAKTAKKQRIKLFQSEKRRSDIKKEAEIKRLREEEESLIPKENLKCI